MTSTLSLQLTSNVQVCNGGLFMSLGRGRHPNRSIDSYELIFVRSGTLKIAEGEKCFEVSPNEYLILQPRVRHWGLEDYAENLNFYWFYFDIIPAPAGESEIQIPQHGAVTKPELLSEYFARLVDDQESGFSYEPVKRLLATLILCELTRPPEPEERTGRIIVWATQANAYIRTHFCEPITRTQIAEIIGCNADYLGKVYQNVYRRKITDSIHDFRIRHAAQLLRETCRSVSEIAEACGYNDLKYFRQQFKLRCGMTPQRYRDVQGKPLPAERQDSYEDGR